MSKPKTAAIPIVPLRIGSEPESSHALLAPKISPPDKTAVGKPAAKRQPQWENPRSEIKFSKAVPFESQLQKEAIMRQRDSVPHSGYVEPQFIPNAIGIMKGGKEAVKAVKQRLK